jgi:metacaspase-1
MPVKRALLVGINAYPNSPLSGCLNDVRLMYKILKEIYGFTEFAVLDDTKATKKNWITTLKNIGKRSKPGDWLVQWFSGHGTQVPCLPETASFETDNFDECPVPFDHDWDNPFRDDDLNGIIKAIDPGVKMFFGMDCCFSGTILKNLPPMKNDHPIKSRYLPPPLHIVLESGEINLDEELNLDTSRHDKSMMKREPFLREVTIQGNAVLISGCSDKQTSADAYIGNKYHGAMTFYLAQTLKEANWNLSYHALAAKMNAKLDKEGYDQDPQLECKKDLLEDLFLGGTKSK